MSFFVVLAERKSKRVPLKKKYRVLKNIKESKRKKKRDMKKHPEKYPKQKDPGIPAKLPFYTKVIEELQAAKENKERRVAEAKQRRKEQKNQIIAKKRNIGDLSIEELIKYAKERGEEFDLRENKDENDDKTLHDRSSRAYYKEFKKVVEAADVVLEVLDARDPLGTRVTQLESVVTGQLGKKLVLILNKADLVPRDNLEKWLKFLRQEYPTIVFKSSTQTQGHRLGQTRAKVMKCDEFVMQTSKALGADVLMQLLKNYCRNKDIKTSITVGVVGLPNVGKSSLINSMKRSKSCGVGATPGFTKALQEIHLDSKIKLLDCPGIILPGKDADDATAALRNSVKLEELPNLYTPVEAILQRANRSQLMIHYRLPTFTTTDEFLCALAKRFGKLLKGGLPDKETAAKKLLQDWNSGIIKYYTQPPAEPDTHIASTIVQEMSAEFDMNSLMETEGNVLEELPMHRPSQTMVIRSLGPIREVKEENSDKDSDMEDDTEREEDARNTILGPNVRINMEPLPESENPKKSEKKPRWETERPVFDPETMSLQKYQKKMMKKVRKERNRNEKRMDGLTLELDNLQCGNEDYDFNEYFK
ncbi:Guanine nucleotide-binding protein-like 3 [Halocaridina rubra]|uniref:Guanine nucleotide-binding protein-like 3 homolog n=1 Tax=Halocaridina rubra TaxID=373956 RepID=A0AAN8X4R4_HALRR